MKIIETKPKTNNMSRETWKYLYKRLGEIANPQLSALKDFLDAPFQMVFSDTEASQKKAYDQYMSVLQLKLDGMTKEPSPIEKTMSLSQLFQSQSPFWANNLTLNRIESILDLYDTIKSDIFFENLKKLIELDEDHAYLSIWNLKFDHRKEA